MAVNCFLPKLCGAKKMRKPAGDDRPFPEQDYLVFPVENMYDRIVLPDSGLTRCKSPTVANNNSQAWQNRNTEKQSTWENEGKLLTTESTVVVSPTYCCLTY